VIEESTALDALRDRIEITDVLYRYASSIDTFDFDGGLRSVLADDLVAQYGNADPYHGADEVVGFVKEWCKTCVMQHHFLSVYHVEVSGDTATALVYHTSHQLFDPNPSVVNVLVGRYRNELRRTDEGWKISKLLLELCWAERRADATGYLDEVGGRGPVA
jgi:ketosteroid isomerase-like protein